MSLLPGDRFVFTLGPYVAMHDPASRRLGLITKGISPVVVMDADAIPPGLELPDLTEPPAETQPATAPASPPSP